MKKSVKNVDECILLFPKEVQLKLIEIRTCILKNEPEASESISYGMPAYKLNAKPLVYFAGFSNHIGFYATPNAHLSFADELSQYKQGKGSVQFPLNKELPIKLIEKMLKFKAAEIRKNQNKTRS
jgi:uncharacterized protein YdhG (YjbR/CyaY superfamily)